MQSLPVRQPVATVTVVVRLDQPTSREELGDITPADVVDLVTADRILFGAVEVGATDAAIAAGADATSWLVH